MYILRFLQDDGSTHPVHKVILAAQSDFFEALFTFEDKTEYQIRDVTQDIMKIIIDAFYDKSTVFDKRPEQIIIAPEIDMMREIIAQAHYFQAQFLLRKSIKSARESFELTIEHTFSTWIFDIMSETLDFARNFQIRELQEEIEGLFKKHCRCGNSNTCYFCRKSKDPYYKVFNLH